MGFGNGESAPKTGEGAWFAAEALDPTH
jgi:hypothetical protein